MPFPATPRWHVAIRFNRFTHRRSPVGLTLAVHEVDTIEHKYVVL
jgi:hypothetical protein